VKDINYSYILIGGSPYPRISLSLSSQEEIKCKKVIVSSLISAITNGYSIAYCDLCRCFEHKKRRILPLNISNHLLDNSMLISEDNVYYIVEELWCTPNIAGQCFPLGINQDHTVFSDNILLQREFQELKNINRSAIEV